MLELHHGAPAWPTFLFARPLLICCASWFAFLPLQAHFWSRPEHNAFLCFSRRHCAKSEARASLSQSLDRLCTFLESFPSCNHAYESVRHAAEYGTWRLRHDWSAQNARKDYQQGRIMTDNCSKFRISFFHIVQRHFPLSNQSSKSHMEFRMKRALHSRRTRHDKRSNEATATPTFRSFHRPRHTRNFLTSCTNNVIYGTSHA
ncbi:uncharacterized protein BKA78DRAFT_66427 [Phyllosticta capitalensis]|uniref:uncharacterized protein n=1 Tax=Phyllosticta capitalensis TaxID=121624 RepID=UPI0031329055